MSAESGYACTKCGYAWDAIPPSRCPKCHPPMATSEQTELETLRAEVERLYASEHVMREALNYVRAAVEANYYKPGVIDADYTHCINRVISDALSPGADSTFRPCPIASKVADAVIERSRAGFKKYGVNADRSDLTLEQWFQHLQEELLDAAVYVEKLKKEQR